MPKILVKIPAATFSIPQKQALVAHLNTAAAQAEHIPDDPKKRALCWVVLEEISWEAWSAGGADLSTRALPCIAQIYIPKGVLDRKRRENYVALVHQAFETLRADDDPRVVLSSVILNEVDDGCWGINGQLWHIHDFAQAAGYTHLQHRVKTEARNRRLQWWK